MSDIVVGVRINADGSGLVGAAKAGESAMKGLGDAAGAAGKKFDDANDSQEKQITSARSLTSEIGRLAAAVGAVQFARQWIEAADSVALLSARIRLNTRDQNEANEIQAKLYESAQRLGVSMNDLGTAFTRFAPAIRDLGGSAATAARLGEIVAASARLAGVSASEASSSMIQFAQALGSGVLQGDELRSILENNSVLAQTLAEGLGTTVGGLRSLGEQGQLTADVVARVVLAAQDKIMSRIGELPETFASGMQRIENAAAMAADQMNRQYGVTKLLASILGEAAGAMDRMRDSSETGSRANMSFADTAKTILTPIAVMADGARVLVGVLKALAEIVVQVGLGLFYLLESVLLPIRLAIHGLVDGMAGVRKVFNDLKGGSDQFSNALERVGDRFRDVGNTQTYTQALFASGKETAKTAGATDNLTASSEALKKKFADMSKGISTASSIAAEHSKKIAEINSYYIAAEANANQRYKSEPAREAALLALQKEKAQFLKAADKDRTDSMDNLAKKETESFEKAVKGAKLAADQKIGFYKFLSEQTKLAIDDALDYENFKRSAGMQTTEQTIKNRIELQDRAAKNAIDGIRREIEINAELVEKIKSTRTIGKENAEAQKLAVQELENKIKESNEKITLAEQARSNAAVKGEREITLARKEAAAELVKADRETQDALKAIKQTSEEYEFQISLIGKSTNEQKILGETRKANLAIAALEIESERKIADLREKGATPELLEKVAAGYAARAQALRDGRDAIPGYITKQDELTKSATALQAAFKQADDTAFAMFESIITGSGKGLDALKQFGNFLKNQLIRWLYEATAQKWVVQITGQTANNAPNIFNNLLGNNAPGATPGSPAIGSLVSMISPSLGSVFSSAGFVAGMGNAIATGLGNLGLTSAAQFVGGATGAIVGPAVPGSALAAGQGLGGMMAAAGPYIAAAMALYSLYQTFSKPRGGPKEAGSYIGDYDSSGRSLGENTQWRMFTDRQYDSQMRGLADGTAGAYANLATRYGGTAQRVAFGFGADSDPKGTAEDRVTGAAWVNGRQIYMNQDRNVGRGGANIAPELQLESQRALVAALQASNLTGEFAKIFNGVDVKTASKETIAELFKLADEIVKVQDVAKLLGGRFATLATEDMKKLTDAFGGADGFAAAVDKYTDAIYTDAEKLATAQDALSKAFAEQKIAVPATAAAYRALVDSQDLTTEAGRKMYQFLISAAPAWKSVQDAVKNATDTTVKSMANLTKAQADSVADTFGGTDAMGESISKFSDIMLSAEEKQTRARKALDQSFADAGLAVPKTIAEYRNLVEAQDLTTAAGRRAFEFLTNAAPAWKDVADAMEQATQAAIQSARALLDSVKNSRDAITRDIFSIVSGRAGFNAVGYYEDQIRDNSARFNSTTGADRVAAGNDLRGSIMNRLNAQRALANKEADQQLRDARAASKIRMDALNAERNAAVQALQAAQAAAEAWNQAIASIKQAADDLLLSDLSPYAAKQRAEIAGASFNQLLAKFDGGDVSAAGQLGNAAQSALRELLSMYDRSSPEYMAEFSRIQGALAARGAAAQMSAFESENLEIARIDSKIAQEQQELSIAEAAILQDRDNRIAAWEQDAIDALTALDTSFGVMQDGIEGEIERLNGQSITNTSRVVDGLDRIVTAVVTLKPALDSATAKTEGAGGYAGGGGMETQFTKLAAALTNAVEAGRTITVP